MTPTEKSLREHLMERLTEAQVDVRNLAIEVSGSVIDVRGSVATEEQRRQALEILSGALVGAGVSHDIGVVPVAPPDSADGRGRSPITGTSADSAYESRHQRDPK